MLVSGGDCPGFKKCHSPGTFATDVVQQSEIVLSRYLQLPRDQAAQLALGQQA